MLKIIHRGERKKLMSDKKRKILLIVLSSLLVIVIGIIAYMLLNNHMIESQYTVAITQAEKYLQDKNYEDALVSYKQALALDPDSEAPYLGLANTYVAMGDTSKAVSILNQGLKRMDSSKLKNLLNLLENSGVENKNSENEKNESQEEPEKSNIAGLVKNAETKDLVQNASLTFTAQDDDSVKETATTDHSGAFKIQLTPGKYTVTITVDDYEEKEIEFEVQEGKTYSEGEFEVTPESEATQEAEADPELEEGTGKFVLQWEDKSLDLHTHFDSYSYGHIHVCYNLLYNLENKGCQKPDWEIKETGNYMTETTTIYDLSQWTCSVYFPSLTSIKPAHGATIKVYLPGESVVNLTLDCTSNEDNIWMIGEIKDGKMEVLNYTVHGDPYTILN